MPSLIEAGVDEYHIVTHPIALGTGMPTFNGLSGYRDVKLADARGAVVHTYLPV